ncbi:STAS domain-containing protein [Trichormus variabilis]|uniref:Anti-sigma factor antagonist n=1 Tax=Trichormus variabilis SAG 1403-4b TaxID=447716 RepID=A0A3S1AA17_ANAVA|nr:STAS domain-containing protein [Trichormus variabilis]MBD2627998.1 STAS domain-containing protein [Trichormus variabilis FACHB-164]RUS96713.1 anti-sigma factor antagonist [Trichormus variabilis SAG 1403-4b]
MNSKIQILEPTGILNATKGNEIRREINDIVSAGAEKLLIDMKDVTFIDSSGLGALVSVMQSLRKTNGELFVCSINAQVKMIFELTKVDRILQILEDREEFQRKVMTTP